MRTKIRKGLLDIIQRKNLIDEFQYNFLLEAMGEKSLLDFILMFPGDIIQIPKTDVLFREYRNDLIGQTLDQCDTRKVRKKLRERWNLTSANLCMIYKKYKKDVEEGKYSVYAMINKRAFGGDDKRNEAKAKGSDKDQKSWQRGGSILAWIESDMNFILRIQAIFYPNNLKSDDPDDDVFTRALHRINRKAREAEGARVRKYLRQDQQFFKLE